MILTQCAVCAAPLGRSLGKKCGRCSTRYCGAECQKQHWEDGGHDKLCKKIKKAGGAEQFYANKKCAEAVAVAVEACADDTKGQTCYICTQALHWKTKEGIVRGCSCRGTAGLAHVSCLAEQAKILVAEALENNLDRKAKNERWHRWDRCSLCEQQYHGVVACALGWACWKTYLGLPEKHYLRINAMQDLGNGLSAGKHHEDALTVYEAELSLYRRLDAPEAHLLTAQGNLASAYQMLGRVDEALPLLRDVYSGTLRLNGEEKEETLTAAVNYASSLGHMKHYAEAKSLLRETIPVARRVLGDPHRLTLKLRWAFVEALYQNDGVTLDELREAVTMLEEMKPTARRVLGGAHPVTAGIERRLREARDALRALEGDVRSIREAVEAVTPGLDATDEEILAMMEEFKMGGA